MTTCYLRGGELAHLIRLSDRSHVANVHYGPSGAWFCVEECPWAAQAILDYRAGRINAAARTDATTTGQEAGGLRGSK